MSVNDLIEAKLLELLEIIRSERIGRMMHYVRPTDEHLRSYGWTEEAITHLHKLERQCLP